MTYEVGLNIGIELMREDEKPRSYICFYFLGILLIELYFLWYEPRSDY